MPGAIDRLDNFGMAGWAASKDGKHASRIRVDVDDVPTFVYIPSDFRADLAKAGWADGFCSLDVEFPKILGLQKAVRIKVWNEETGELLSGNPLYLDAAIKCGRRYPFEVPRAAASVAPLSATFQDDVCLIRGLGVFPLKTELSAEVAEGSAEVLAFRNEPQAAELGAATGQIVYSFELRVRSNENCKFSLIRVAPQDFVTGTSAFACLVAIPGRAPGPSDLPPHENMSRVSGQQVTPGLFAVAGLTTAAKLNQLALQLGKPLRDCRAILDWGAGIGRVARHVRDHFAPVSELWCVDVDQVNIREITNFVRDSTCSLIAYYPPTDLPSDYFDFIYGISVFTHLTEGAQEVWLRELQRISRPGALLVMSANTEFAAIHLSSKNVRCIRDLLLFGISDNLLDGNLGMKLDRSNYYRSTYHLSEYIRGEWSKYFEVIDIVPRADVHTQDFVVLRKI